ncbi:MAG: hypothetical protein UT66_C0027G0003 [candidate division CPR2 bacterium GW2011_GWC1_39_9]|uniref:Glycosyltransferase RgtA/B/C/D-like domain-containing protein n=1 Tax=candidate division CPR2 bacterium GW2011_GWC2_39_10 TaxID=1618345 RepID=A0A0G0LRI7_UNCC2|nr:MAG: hypothetical protein UT18_C0017G0012 [candidate division CPR2 bacterium GW2011_GWC2_39_10]KKR34172.1 MAG: hypothetical protein UT66_C0027G0003 [candidate division CPR2 bacterium GW2011_GWC1_39_9]
MTKNRKRLPYIVFIFFGVFTSGLFLLSFLKPLMQDEGVFLKIASGLNNGQLPYLNYFDHKNPAIYYLFAVFLKISTSALSLKIFLLITNLCSIFLISKISSKINPKAFYPALFLSLLAFTFFEGNFLITEPFGIFFLLLSLYLFLNNILTYAPFLSGLLACIAFLFKQTFIVNIAVLAFFYFKKDKRSFLDFSAGFLASLLALILYFAKIDILSSFFNQAYVLNFTAYPKEPLFYVVKKLSFTFLQTLPLWFLFILSFTKKIREGKLTIFYAMFFAPTLLFLTRHYPHYWIQIIPFAIIPAAFAITKIYNEKKIFNLFLVITALSLFIASIWFFKDTNFNIKKLKEEKAATIFLKNLPEKQMIAENQFVSFYFLTGKNPVNKYLYLTEITDSENGEEKTLNYLKENPKTIIVWTKNKDFAYAKELQTYILKNYEIIKEFPELEMVVYALKY